ncbi:profilin, required for normal timing of actin polymerization in response to thermal stress [Kickxella alabastrina]|uniref:Profilin, required for normal timing of actin polymerization in response to thermal stress n=1 Tax=Kickxella alabastrina TaxID=61397 RepID=A0ACC1ISF9_9FUNG|nr:profilin, required for normal timing of actin polymerization in response to thermal stress [Kickxella alabastrina]
MSSTTDSYTTWDSYVASLVGSGKIAMAAIYGHDGGLWAKSEGLDLVAGEFEKISSGFEDPANLRMSGTYIGGTKFMTNQTDKSFIFAKYKSPSEENPNPNPNNFDCVMCAKTIHAIIIACVPDNGTQAGEARAVIQSIADHLIGLGY